MESKVPVVLQSISLLAVTPPDCHQSVGRYQLRICIHWGIDTSKMHLLLKNTWSQCGPWHRNFSFKNFISSYYISTFKIRTRYRLHKTLFLMYICSGCKISLLWFIIAITIFFFFLSGFHCPNDFWRHLCN